MGATRDSPGKTFGGSTREQQIPSLLLMNINSLLTVFTWTGPCSSGGWRRPRSTPATPSGAGILPGHRLLTFLGEIASSVPVPLHPLPPPTKSLLDGEFHPPPTPPPLSGEVGGGRGREREREEDEEEEEELIPGWVFPERELQTHQ